MLLTKAAESVRNRRYAAPACAPTHTAGLERENSERAEMVRMKHVRDMDHQQRRTARCKYAAT